MDTTYFTFAAISLILFIAIGIKLFQTSRSIGNPGGSPPEIDPSRYKPMERMLRSEEFSFLARQGMNARAIRRLRTQRRNIFRKYLHSLAQDFSRVVGAVRYAMVESHEARPDLAGALFRARAIFTYALFMIHLRLFAHTLGMSTLAIDVTPLIAALERMQQFGTASGMAAASAA